VPMSGRAAVPMSGRAAVPMSGRAHPHHPPPDMQ